MLSCGDETDGGDVDCRGGVRFDGTDESSGKSKACANCSKREGGKVWSLTGVDKDEGDLVKGEYKNSSHESDAGKSKGGCSGVCEWKALRGAKDATKAGVRTSSGMCASSKALLSSTESVTASCINEVHGECFIIRESVVNTDCTKMRRGRRGRHRTSNDQRHRLRKLRSAF
jgi:hypothetical protein